MDIKRALKSFASLSQDTRLQAMRILVEYGTEGIAAGDLSAELGIPQNTLSFHLAHLSQAGLVSAHKQGRQIIYKARLDTVQSLIGFLLDNCCTRQSTTKFTAKSTTPKAKRATPKSACCE
jgi:DNA-binding transcriptional ArsR family regulator